MTVIKASNYIDDQSMASVNGIDFGNVLLHVNYVCMHNDYTVTVYLFIVSSGAKIAKQI